MWDIPIGQITLLGCVWLVKIWVTESCRLGHMTKVLSPIGQFSMSYDQYEYPAWIWNQNVDAHKYGETPLFYYYAEK